MPITDRQKGILWAVIEEYAKKAEPVSSKALSQKRGFEIGAPMIRKEMNQLEQYGFLISPHTSAGRVPTDKAYRMYIQVNMSDKSNETPKTNKEGLTSKEAEKVVVSLQKKWPDEQSLLKEISRLASEISKELSIAGAAGGGNLSIFGFSNLIDEPEFSSFAKVSQLMHFMDNMDHCFHSLWDKLMYENLQVFIGDENPIKEIDEITLITGKYQLPDGDDGFIFIIGPKRMNYRRNMALVEHINEVISSL